MKSKKMMFLGLTIIATIGIGFAVALNLNSTSTGATEQQDDVSYEERVAAYVEAEAKGAALADQWPGTPEELIYDFWEAASRKDYERLVLLCPGAQEKDFKNHYETWTPSPATAIGTPEPHPAVQGVQVYPVRVPFPGFPNKTIKMALLQMEDGRLGINGQHTIWW